MRLQVKGKNVEVSDTIRRYAEEKMKKLDRQLHELTQVELELRIEKNPSIAANQVAEATIWTKGPTLRAREASEDMKASIDQLTEKLLRQVEHYRAKRRGRQVRANGIAPGGPMSIPDDEETGPQIVKTKQFAVKPMSAEEGGLVEPSTRPLFTGVIPETGIHGIPRERQYDAIVTTDAPGVEGTSARFVGLEDGSLVVEEGEGDLTVLAEAIEREAKA